MSSSTKSDALNALREEYISISLNKGEIDQQYVEQRLKLMGYKKNDITNILLDFEDEFVKEALARKKSGSSIKLGILGLVIAIAFMTLTILSILTNFLGNGTYYLFIGAIVSGFMTAEKGFTERKNRKRRIEVRNIFWEGRY